MKSAPVFRNLNRWILLSATAVLASLSSASAQTGEAGGDLQQKKWPLSSNRLQKISKNCISING